MKPLRYVVDIFLCVLCYVLQELDRFWDTFGNFVKTTFVVVTAMAIFLLAIHFLNKIPAAPSHEDQSRAEYIKLLEEQNEILTNLLKELQK